MEAALRDDPSFMQESLLSRVTRGNLNWVNTLRLRLDAIEYEWNRRVVNYDEEVQFELFQELFGEVTDHKVMLLLFTLASIVILGIALTVIRFEPRSKRAPANRLYRRVSAELERVGLGRQKGEGPIAYCERVAEARPELSALMRELTALYVQVSYHDQQISANEARQQLRLIKSLYTQLRLRLMPFSRLRNPG